MALGRSEVEPGKGDRRFTDPAWSGNPIFSRIERGYLATAQAVGNVVGELGQSADNQPPRRAGPLRHHDPHQRAVPHQLLRHQPGGDQARVRHRRQEPGARRAQLRRRRAQQRRHALDGRARRVRGGQGPRAVPRRASCSATRWASSSSTSPRTEQVHKRPLVIIPPPIGRFYFLDLRPGRSFVEYATSQGIQVFLLSAGATPAPTKATGTSTPTPPACSPPSTPRARSPAADDVNVMGFCAGGIITTTLLNHLAAIGDDRVHSMSYAVTLLDFAERAPITALPGRRACCASPRPGRGARASSPAARWAPRSPGCAPTTWSSTTGQQLPHGRQAARVRHPGLERRRHEPARRAARRSSSTSSRATCSPSPAACPCWAARCSSTRSRRRCSSPARSSTTSPRGWAATAPPSCSAAKPTFVLSYSGHIASLVNPPGNPKAHYWTGGTPGPDPQKWLAEATKQQGSWWEAWIEWFEPHGGGKKKAPRSLGNKAHPVVDPAPGRYVHSWSRAARRDRPARAGVVRHRRLRRAVRRRRGAVRRSSARSCGGVGCASPRWSRAPCAASGTRRACS